MLQTFIENFSNAYFLAPAEKILLLPDLFIIKQDLEQLSETYKNPYFSNYYSDFEITKEESLSIELLRIWRENELYSKMLEELYNDFRTKNHTYEAELSDLRNEKQQLENEILLLANENHNIFDNLSNVYVDIEQLNLENSNKKLLDCNKDFEQAIIRFKKKEALPIIKKFSQETN